MPDLRSFCLPPELEPKEIRLSREESHHLVTTNSARVGDTVVVFDGRGTECRTIRRGGRALHRTGSQSSEVASGTLSAPRSFRRLVRILLTRPGLANLYRPAQQTVTVVLSLGFGAFLLSTLFLVQHNLLRDLRVGGPGERPNLVFFDIQADQREGVEAELPQHEQPPNERYSHNERIKAYITEVRKSQGNEPSIVVSRTHPGLIRRLFEIEVPEIRQGVIETSNVDPVVEMVGLMATQRAYESFQKVIRAVNDTYLQSMRTVGAVV